MNLSPEDLSDPRKYLEKRQAKINEQRKKLADEINAERENRAVQMEKALIDRETVQKKIDAAKETWGNKADNRPAIKVDRKPKQPTQASRRMLPETFDEFLKKLLAVHKKINPKYFVSQSLFATGSKLVWVRQLQSQYPPDILSD